MTDIAVMCSERDEATDGSQISTLSKPTSGHVTHAIGREEWIASMRDSLARIYPLPDKEQGSTAHDPVFGQKSCDSFARYDPSTHSWRMSQQSLLEGSTECLQTFPSSGSMRNGRLYQRPMSARHICVGGGGAWLPTPTAGTYGSCQGGSAGRAGQKNRPSLHTMARQGLWPTIRASKIREEVVGSLNPAWVEWLIGWPLGWTACEPLETDKCRSAPPQRG